MISSTMLASFWDYDATTGAVFFDPDETDSYCETGFVDDPPEPEEMAAKPPPTWWARIVALFGSSFVVVRHLRPP